MSFNKLGWILVCCLVSLGTGASEVSKSSQSKVKFKASSRIDFESLLIEGERKKPEMAVVTGNIGEKDSGLLKFRKDFTDVMADDLGESIE